MSTTLIYASDHHGVLLQKKLAETGRKAGITVKEIESPDASLLDVLDISQQLAAALCMQPEALAIMIGDNLQGAVIALNRSTAIRAVRCHTAAEVQHAREALNANVLCIESGQPSFEHASALVNAFVATPFAAGPHTASLQKLAVHPTQHASHGINLIVRAIILHDRHILLTTPTASNHDFASNLYFLPGGHVDHNESCLAALKRELFEEMAVTIEQATFKGVLECSWSWPRRGVLYHEINVIYQVSINGLDLAIPPVAIDHYQTFIWWPIAKLATITLLPTTLQPLLHNVLNAHETPNFYSEMQQEIG